MAARQARSPGGDAARRGARIVLRLRQLPAGRQGRGCCCFFFFFYSASRLTSDAPGRRWRKVSRRAGQAGLSRLRWGNVEARASKVVELRPDHPQRESKASAIGTRVARRPAISSRCRQRAGGVVAGSAFSAGFKSLHGSRCGCSPLRSPAATAVRTEASERDPQARCCWRSG